MPPIADRDLLTASLNKDLHTDEVRLELHSRYFDWRGGIRFTATEVAFHSLPSERTAIDVCLAAFGPLFRACSAMPFGRTLLRQLLAATMDRLLPQIRGQLVQLGERQRFVSTRRLELPTQTTAAEWERAGQADRDQALMHIRNMEMALIYDRVPSAPPPSYQASKEAIARSRETLLHCLSPVQQAEFARDGKFTVVAQNGQRFTVHQMESYNVSQGDTCYCALPAEPCPVFDKMLASKLWLEADFDRFMATAERRARSPGRDIYAAFAAELVRPRMRDIGNL